MINQVTLQDKALAYLSRYTYIKDDIEYGAPYEITQDGIATALGISRSHASIIVSKMEEGGEVTVSRSTVKNASRAHRRMVYHLTELGKRRYKERFYELLAFNIDLNELLDNQEIDESVFRSYPVEQTDLIGCLCVIRRTVTKNTFPPDIRHVTYRPTGEVIVKDHVKNNILKFAGENDLIRWHSKAADWCLDHCADIIERLYHLTKAHRDIEALKIIRSR